MGWFSSSNDKSIRCLNEYFLRTCGSCMRLNTSSIRSGKAYCSYVSYAHRLDESVGGCRKYEGPVDPEKRDYADLYYELTGRRYYFILTVICEVLGIDQNHELYQEFKALIQLVRSDSSTEKEAVAYNAFGFEISEKLIKDENAYNICSFLLTNYLSKAFILIKENKPEEAISVYKEMVTFLFIKYRKEENYSNIIKEEAFQNPKILIKK